jgi:hypothetical protein
MHKANPFYYTKRPNQVYNMAQTGYLPSPSNLNKSL